MIKDLVLIGIFLLTPISFYLIYITYIVNLDIKEKDIFLNLCIVSALFLIAKYLDNKSLYLLLFCNIPLLISYLKDKNTLSIYLSIIVIYLYHNYLYLPIVFLILEYSTYYLLKISKIKDYLNYFIFIKILITSFEIVYLNSFSINNILLLLIISLIFIFYTYLSIYLFRLGLNIINYHNVLEESHKDKTLIESLSKLTHELKNPLTVVSGYLEMLNNNPNNLNKYLSIMINEVDKTLDVINNFSYFGKLKKLNLEEVDLVYLLEEVVNMLKPIYKKNKATIRLNTPHELYMNLDYLKMREAFTNILKNSLEAKKDESLLVEISIKKMLNNIKIRINDNGVGMDKETLDHIYDMFYTTKENGNGLGVDLIKEIIELHQGNIKYSSVKGIGTTIIINLPLN